MRIAEKLETAGVDELDADIDRCLQLLGLELELTIVSVVEQVDERLVTRYQWRSNGYMDPPFELDLTSAQWWRDHISEDEDVIIDHTDNLPDSAEFERGYLAERSTASLVAIPGGFRSHLFLIAEALWMPREWEADDLRLLAGAARHLGVALTRQIEKRRLVAMATQASADSEAKNAFIATLAHELKTPLTGVLGYAQLLASKVVGPLNQQQEQYVANILDCAEHLDRIVNESLTLATIDSNNVSLKLSDVDVRKLAQTAVATVAPRARHAGLDLDLELPEVPVVITADALKIKQVLINLVSNAIKYTPKGSIVITVRPLEEAVLISVRDTGIGIPSGNLERIFESFARVHRRRDEEGTGLGLALVKRLVELHEGRIEVESEQGVGSCFSITLPRRPLANESGRTAYVRSVV